MAVTPTSGVFQDAHFIKRLRTQRQPGELYPINKASNLAENNKESGQTIKVEENVLVSETKFVTESWATLNHWQVV